MQEAFQFRFLEKPGPYGVGLRIVGQYDPSRVFVAPQDGLGQSFGGERARPIQTLIWYPANDAAKPLTVRDYVNLAREETRFGNTELPQRAREWQSGMAPVLDRPLWAMRDAAEAAGTFPVVVYAPSFSSVAWENADLCEYLASHGFIVLSSASLGATTRAMTTDLAGLDTQARDISYLIGYAKSLANADTGQIAVIGFSWGGLANVFAAARDDRIGALVALDGSLRYWPGLVKQAKDVKPDRMTVPLLSFARAEWTLEEIAKYFSPEQLDGPNVLNAWTHGDLYDVHMPGMTHRQFTSMGQRNEDFWTEAENPAFLDRRRKGYSREDSARGYGIVARYTLAFLQAYLGGDAEAHAVLARDPAEARFVDVHRRRAAGLPPTLETFRAEIGRRGFFALDVVFAELRERDETLSFPEHAVADWAETLIDTGHLSEALALLAFNARLHPQSSAAFGNLGRAQLLAGDRDAAAASYRVALEKSPQNADARRKLAALAAKPGGGSG